MHEHRKTDEYNSLWFNLGSQARIEGRPIQTCTTRNQWERLNWQRGWRFTDRNWNTAPGCTGNPLPEVFVPAYIEVQ